MKLQLPNYTSKDYVVLALVLLPYILAMNLIIFGAAYISGLQFFLLSTFITGNFLFCFFCYLWRRSGAHEKAFPV